MEINWTLLLALLALPGLIAAAIVWIYFQDRKVRSWKEAPGRIVSSKPVARTIRKTLRSTSISRAGTHDSDTDETLETRNFADIRYEFSVAGKAYAGSRISLAKDQGNFEVAEVLRRYPEDKIVTIVYDPAQPTTCLLERDDPKNIRLAWAVVAGLTLFILAAFFGSGPVVSYLDQATATMANKPLVIALSLFALVVSLFACLLGKQTRLMKAWPKVSGRIVHSAVETTGHTHHPSHATKTQTITMYVPRILYKFEVGGIAYQGDNLGGTTSSNRPAAAARTVARYAVDAPVVVLYNPLNPSESTLDARAGFILVGLWGIAVLLAIGACAAAGVFMPLGRR